MPPDRLEQERQELTLRLVEIVKQYKLAPEQLMEVLTEGYKEQIEKLRENKVVLEKSGKHKGWLKSNQEETTHAALHLMRLAGKINAAGVLVDVPNALPLVVKAGDESNVKSAKELLFGAESGTMTYSDGQMVPRVSMLEILQPENFKRVFAEAFRETDASKPERDENNIGNRDHIPRIPSLSIQDVGIGDIELTAIQNMKPKQRLL